MSAPTPSSLLQLPGGEFVSEGLADLAGERESVPAFLLAIAAQRLSAAGLPLPAKLPREPELRLYRMLRSLHGDGAHSQFNASLCQTLEKSGRGSAACPANRGVPAS